MRDYLLGRDVNGNPVGNGTKTVTFSSSDSRFYSAVKWIEGPPTAADGSPLYSQDVSGELRGYAVSSKPISSSHLVPTCPNYDKEGNLKCPDSDCCVTFNSKTFVRGGDGVFRTGQGCTGKCWTLNKKGELVTIPAKLLWVEPLEGSFTLNNGAPLLRNGSTSEVMFEATFSGKAIPLQARVKGVKASDGGELPMPVVVFDAWKEVVTTDPSSGDEITTIVRDSDTALSQNSVQLSVSRTKEANGHYHLCTVDNDGNGETTDTIGDVGHTHQIVSFVVEETNAHTHGVRSIAVTNLNSILDQDSCINVSATIEYDASKTFVVRKKTFTATDCPDILTGTKYSLKLFAPKEVEAQRYLDSSIDGFTVEAQLQKTTDGEIDIIPDGQRISFEFVATRPKSKDDQQDTVEGVWKLEENGTGYQKRPYLVLKVRAFAEIDGVRVAKSALISVVNRLPYEPMVKGLLPEPTNDSLYLTSLPNAENFGQSQIHDAVYEAAGRLQAWQLEDATRQDWAKAVILISDGWENESVHSITESIASIQRLAGNKKTPCAPVFISAPTPQGRLVMEKYASETGSELSWLPQGQRPLPASSSSTSSEDNDGLMPFIESLFSSALSSANYGTYTGQVDLNRTKLINNITFTLQVPSNGAGSMVAVRLRFSADAESWTAWSGEYQLTNTGTISLPDTPPNLYRYMQYWVGFIGNSNFVAPTLHLVGGQVVEPRESFIFFAPIRTNAGQGEIVSEVIISDRTESSSFSKVTYGYTASDSTNEIDYSSAAQPLTYAERRKITLTRSNEPLVRLTANNFLLLNGGWPASTEIEIYDLSEDPLHGTLVPPGSYSANSASGRITFADAPPADAQYSASLVLPPLFRLLCHVVNYSSTEAVKLKHVGVTFNVTELPQDIHTTLASRISSSSSSSSESGVVFTLSSSSA
jgi:hypothetical protein